MTNPPPSHRPPAGEEQTPGEKTTFNKVGLLSLALAIIALIALREPLAGILLAIVAGAVALLALRDRSKTIGAAVGALTVGTFVITIGIVITIATAASRSSTTQDAANGETAQSATPEPTALSEEQRFIQTVQQTAAQADGVQNDLKVDDLVAQRNVAICDDLDDQGLNDWTGTITEIGADSLKYQAYLTIEIAPDITVGTWNNAFSDLGDDTLIDRKNALFSDLSHYDVGDAVVFSGTLLEGADDECISGKNANLSDYATSPEFLAKFTALRAG